MCFKRKAGSFPRIMTKSNRAVKIPHLKTIEVLPRFELGSLDSESRVLTITPQGRCEERVINSVLNQECLNVCVDEIRTQFAMIDFTENMPDIPYMSSFGTASKIC